MAGLTLPVAMESTVKLNPPAQRTESSVEFTYRDLGKTGLKPTSVGFGCMITSDQSVVEKAADIGITFFDTARGYQNGNNERMVGAALKSKKINWTACTVGQFAGQLKPERCKVRPEK